MNKTHLIKIIFVGLNLLPILGLTETCPPIDDIKFEDYTHVWGLLGEYALTPPHGWNVEAAEYYITWSQVDERASFQPIKTDGVSYNTGFKLSITTLDFDQKMVKCLYESSKEGKWDEITLYQYISITPQTLDNLTHDNHWIVKDNLATCHGMACQW